jgi:hypothetical protein
MKYIKFFEGLIVNILDKIEIDIDGMLIELIDNNFSIKKFYLIVIFLFLLVKKVNFKYDEIKIMWIRC